MKPSKELRRIQRFNRRNHIPKEHDADFHWFKSLFPIGQRDYIRLFRNPRRKKDWYMNRGFGLNITDIARAITGEHSHFIGVRNNKVTRYAVLDIDKGSKYHSREGLDQIQAALNYIRLESVVFQSSNSGGWHLMIFLENIIDSEWLHDVLKQYLIKQGFEIKRGQLEVFPNPGTKTSKGFGLRIPLQPEFEFLNQETLEIDPTGDPLDRLLRFRATHDHYLNLMSYYDEKTYVCWSESLTSLVNSVIDGTNKPEPLGLESTNYNRCSTTSAVADALVPVQKTSRYDQQKWNLGKTYYEQGLSQPSTRHYALLAVGYYLFYGDPDAGIPALGYAYAQERYSLLIEWIDSKNHGFSDQVKKNVQTVYAEIRRMADWVSSNLKNSPWLRAAKNRTEEAIKNLKLWVTKLSKQGIASANEFCKVSGISRTFLRKHKDLWEGLLLTYKELESQSTSVHTLANKDQIQPSKPSKNIWTHLTNVVKKTSDEIKSFMFDLPIALDHSLVDSS